MAQGLSAGEPFEGHVPQGLRVLIVEDDLMLASEVRGIVELLGGAVAGVATALADGLDAALELDFDVALVAATLRGQSSAAILTLLATTRRPCVLTIVGEPVPERFADMPVLAKPVRPSRLGPVLAAAMAQDMGTSSKMSTSDSQRG